MKLYEVIFYCLFPFLLMANEENLIPLSQQAEALWEAHDYISSSHLYEPLLSRSLPTWQQARLFYNLGSLRLAQHQTPEALAFFQKMTPSDLSLPRFGRDLFLNEGIAYLQYAQTLILPFSSTSIGQQALFIEQSLQAFEKAQNLNCNMQKIEQTTDSSCFYSLLDQWTKIARLQLDTLHQQKRQNWIKQASLETLATFLHYYLLELIHSVNNLQNSSKTSFRLYFQHQTESFIPIWNALQQKEFSLSQKTAFDQAISSYLNALKQQELSSFLKELKQGIEALTPLTFQDHQDLQLARLNYEIVLLQDPLSVSNLQNLLSQFDQLKVEKSRTALLDQIKKNLQTSLQELQSQHLIQARFFLLAGFSAIHSLIPEKITSPALLLQQGLEQASRALELSLLFQLMPEEESFQKTQLQTVLKNQQQEVLVQAALFIPAVIQEQKLRFQQAKNPTSGCQQSPWDQVIPLFDQGEQAAQQAEKYLKQTPFHAQAVIGGQEQTIKNWQQALNLILNPPQSASSDASTASNPQNLNETFRLIQEMYLQDQSQPEQPTQELHSW